MRKKEMQQKINDLEYELDQEKQKNCMVRKSVIKDEVENLIKDFSLQIMKKKCFKIVYLPDIRTNSVEVKQAVEKLLTDVDCRVSVKANVYERFMSEGTYCLDNKYVISLKWNNCPNCWKRSE